MKTATFYRRAVNGCERIFHRLPGPVARPLIVYEHSLFKRSLIHAICSAPITTTGVDADGVPYAVCTDRTRLSGRLPEPRERKAYRALRKHLPAWVEEDTYRIALDVVLRYQYPHALPGLTMPYSPIQRAFFHPQHQETLADCTGLDEAGKRELTEIFSPRPGEVFLDVGSFLGFGALRVRQQVGRETPIVAVEAQWYDMLKRNVDQNDAPNVHAVQRTISNRRATQTIYKHGRQRNSLVKSIVDRKVYQSTELQGEDVQTDTLASVLDERGFNSVGLVSLTINGAEPEAIEGLLPILANSQQPRVTLAGWYKRDGRTIAELTQPLLERAGLHVLVTPGGRVLAWKPRVARRKAA